MKPDKDKSITYMWNLKKKKDTNELISKIVRNSADIEDKIMLTKRERGLREGITLEAVIFIFI